MIEQLHIIRRIAERGLKVAQRNKKGEFVDLFQHMLDEVERLIKEQS